MEKNWGDTPSATLKTNKDSQILWALIHVNLAWLNGCTYFANTPTHLSITALHLDRFMTHLDSSTFFRLREASGRLCRANIQLCR